MRILIPGANGQVGMALRRILTNPTFECKFTDRAELDMRDEETVRAITLSYKPDVVINCAAYTAVDKAENETQAAVEINQDAVRVLAEACSSINARFIHISTDYVYHNLKNRPLREDDPTNPQSVYARTKLAGEKEALSACAKTTVLRTSWVFGLEGNNFVRTMARLGADRDKLTVVSDQIGAPTFADDIAKAILHVIESPELKPGTYNYAGLGVASWYDFAKAIMETYGLSCAVKPIPTTSYPTPAARPHYSVLDLQKAQAAGFPFSHWRDALAEFKALDAT
ncbi:MAG: dTDP-4-dehydrorhamnose reductase [Saprospiraceae bacterium]